MNKVFEAHITIFSKNLKATTIDAEGTRSNIADTINKLLKDNESANNVQIVIRGKK